MANRRLVALLLFIGMMAVAIGAFGAHALQPFMDERGMANFQTANRYHFYHILLALIIAFQVETKKILTYSILFSLVGILLFSGSLYLIALKSKYAYPAWLPILTPIGGLCFLLAWILAAYHFLIKLKN